MKLEKISIAAYFVVIAIGFAIMGCSHNDQKDQYEKLVNQSSVDRKIVTARTRTIQRIPIQIPGRREYTAEYVMTNVVHDGHTYILVTNIYGHYHYIMHAPSCSCMQQEQK